MRAIQPSDVWLGVWSSCLVWTRNSQRIEVVLAPGTDLVHGGQRGVVLL